MKAPGNESGIFNVRDDIKISQCYFNPDFLERMEGVTAHLGSGHQHLDNQNDKLEYANPTNPVRNFCKQRLRPLPILYLPGYQMLNNVRS